MGSLDTIDHISECLATSKTVKKNNTPGSKGLTVEFYLAFWPLVGKYLLDWFNLSIQKLGNSNKKCWTLLFLQMRNYEYSKRLIDHSAPFVKKKKQLIGDTY